MSSLIPLNQEFDKTVQSNIETVLAQLQTLIKPILVTLHPTLYKQLITVSGSREALMADIYNKLVKAYPETIPTQYSEQEIEQQFKQRDYVQRTQALVQAIANDLAFISKVYDNNLFYSLNDVYGNAKHLGKHNSIIKDNVNDISQKHYEGRGKKKPLQTAYTIGADTFIKLSNVKPGTMFTNKGDTILTILVVDGAASNLITINPRSGKRIPAKWVNIIVTNLSTAEAGAFEVIHRR